MTYWSISVVRTKDAKFSILPKVSVKKGSNFNKMFCGGFHNTHYFKVDIYLWEDLYFDVLKNVGRRSKELEIYGINEKSFYKVSKSKIFLGGTNNFNFSKVVMHTRGDFFYDILKNFGRRTEEKRDI